MKYKNITYQVGDTMGNCVYLGEAPSPAHWKSKPRFGRFKCPCGAEFNAPNEKVIGRGQKCNDCAKANLAAIVKANFKHGFGSVSQRHKVYKLWLGIKDRCYNPNSEYYHLYGGRGIAFYEPWRNDFAVFYAAIGDPPTKKHSFDRFPDNDGNYQLDNWRWATQTQQMRNTSVSISVQYEGSKWNLHDLYDKLGLNYCLVCGRYTKQGFTLEQALTQPLPNVILLDTKTGIYYDSIIEASTIFGIPKTTLSRYVHNPSKNKTSLIIV